MSLYAKSILVTIAGLILLVILGGCAYTVDGQRIPREVYRTEAAQDLMTLAVAADREYDSRNPIEPPPAFCGSEQPQTDMAVAAICALSMAAYNAQLQVRDMERKAQVAYASAVIDRQADERMAKWNLALNNPLTAALAQRYIIGSQNNGSNAPRIDVRGHTVASRGSGGGGGAGGGGGGESGVAGAGSGGGAETGVNGDQNVVIVVGDGNQSGGGSGSTWSPSLQWATDLGSTNPSFGEGVQDNRNDGRSDDDNIGFDEIF